MERRFFLLPSDLSIEKQSRITPKFIRENTSSQIKNLNLEKKKKNIFNDNLSSLIGKVTEKKTIINAPKLILKEESNLDLIEKIYTQPNPEDSLIQYLNLIFNEIPIRAYCLLFLERATETYRPFLSQNLTEITKQNLFFHSKDPILETQKIEFTNERIQDTFLMKKFSVQDFREFDGMHILPLIYKRFSIIICMFYKTIANKTEKELSESLQSMIQKMFPVIPYLTRKIELVNDTLLDQNDILQISLNRIKESMKKIGDKLYFSTLRFISYSNTPNSEEVKKKIIEQLTSKLSPTQIILHSHFNKIILLSKEPLNQKLIDFFIKNKEVLVISTKQYPENGKNLFLYI